MIKREQVKGRRGNVMILRCTACAGKQELYMPEGVGAAFNMTREKMFARRHSLCQAPDESVPRFGVVVAIGANDLTIPCLVFTDVDTAHAFMEKAFGAAYSRETGVSVDEVQTEPRDHEAPHMLKATSDSSCIVDVTKFFTNYYSGCGGFYHLEVREIAAGTSFIAWNLD